MSSSTPPENPNQIDLRDKAVEEATGGNGPKAARFKTGETARSDTRERTQGAGRSDGGPAGPARDTGAD